MRRLAELLRKEEGWALGSSLLVVGILISLSLPLLSLVDGQQAQSAHERKSESSFNLAEAAFDATVFVMSKDWPARDRGPYDCTPGSASERCPSPDILARTYNGGDYTNPGWTVQVRDDCAPGGSDFYDPAEVPSQPSYDANRNAKMWVRADAHAAGADRTVVALVRRQDALQPFPRNAVTAGWFRVATGGYKAIVDTKGDAAQASPVAVRCTTWPAPSPGCLEYYPDRGQVSPDTAYTGYAGDSAITAEALDGLRAKATALGTYYETSCPSSPVGELVFVESANCAYAGGGKANSAASPGMFILASGTLEFGGGFSYYGLIYAANGQGSSGAVITLSGASTVYGAVAADGNGGIIAGSNGLQIVYSAAVFPLIKSFNGAAAVQGTWRELPAS